MMPKRECRYGSVSSSLSIKLHFAAIHDSICFRSARHVAQMMLRWCSDVSSTQFTQRRKVKSCHWHIKTSKQERANEKKKCSLGNKYPAGSVLIIFPSWVPLFAFLLCCRTLNESLFPTILSSLWKQTQGWLLKGPTEGFGHHIMNGNVTEKKKKEKS